MKILIFHSTLLYTAVICTIGCFPYVHVWDQNRQKSCPHKKNTNMAAWKENWNCQSGKTKTDKICGRISKLDSGAKKKKENEKTTVWRRWLWRALKAKRHWFSLLRCILCKHLAEWLCVCEYIVCSCVYCKCDFSFFIMTFPCVAKYACLHKINRIFLYYNFFFFHWSGI